MIDCQNDLFFVGVMVLIKGFDASIALEIRMKSLLDKASTTALGAKKLGGKMQLLGMLQVRFHLGL
jgi:hypothetical protein